jgi:hypothetical protein
MMPGASAGPIEKMSAAECVFHFVADGGVNDVTRIRDKSGKIIYSPSAFYTAVEVVTATLGSPGMPLAEKAQKWDALQTKTIDIDAKLADLPRNTDEFRRLLAERQGYEPALAAARAELDRTVKPLAERVLKECDATLRTLPATIAEKNLDQTKLDGWFERHSKTSKEELARIGRELDFSNLGRGLNPDEPKSIEELDAEMDEVISKTTIAI